jgi:hypothetical protein
MVVRIELGSVEGDVHVIAEADDVRNPKLEKVGEDNGGLLKKRSVCLMACLGLTLVRRMILLSSTSEAPLESRFMTIAISRTGRPQATNVRNRRSRSSARSSFNRTKGSAFCSSCRASRVSRDSSGELRCDSAIECREDLRSSQDERNGLFGDSGILDIASQIFSKVARCRRWYLIPASRTRFRSLVWLLQCSLLRVAAISSSPSARCQARTVVPSFWLVVTMCDAAAPTISSSHACICNSPRSSRSISATACLMSNDLSVLPDGRRLGPTRFTDQPCYNPATAVNTLSKGQACASSGRSGMVYLVYFPAAIAPRSHFDSNTPNGLTIYNYTIIGSCAAKGRPSPMQ